MPTDFFPTGGIVANPFIYPTVGFSDATPTKRTVSAQLKSDSLPILPADPWCACYGTDVSTNVFTVVCRVLLDNDQALMTLRS